MIEGNRVEDLEAIRVCIAQHAPTQGALLPLLHAIQDRLGYIPAIAIPSLAEALNLSRAEVHGVLSFYHYFRREPVGTHVVHVCRAEACQAVGGRALEAHVKGVLGIDFHDTTADRRVTLEPVYCLGNCACGPAVLIDGELCSHVTPERFDALIAARRGE